MKIQIDGKEISEAEIEGWENKRRLKTIKTLKNKFGLNLKKHRSNENWLRLKDPYQRRKFTADSGIISDSVIL